MDLQLLIAESAQLLVIGMGTVFIILIMLIFLINMVSRILPEEVVEPLQPVARRGSTAKPAAGNNSELVAVVSAAVRSYKNRHRS
jgi:oxaloacetate decarboxylase gamma subunit